MSRRGRTSRLLFDAILVLALLAFVVLVAVDVVFVGLRYGTEPLKDLPKIGAVR